MPKQSFKNTKEFGRTIRTLRETVQQTSIEAVEKAGGPSASTQSRIENGVVVSVTDTTIGKYVTAFGPGANMLWALASAHKHATSKPSITGRTAGDVPVRKRGRREKASESAGASERPALYLGQFLDSGEPVIGGALEYPERLLKSPLGSHAVTYQVDESEVVRALATPVDGYMQFRKAAVAIADRQAGLVLLASREGRNSWPKGVGEGLLLSNHKRFAFGEFGSELPRVAVDPIAGVSTFAAAKRRASALGAGGADLRLTAWVILLSNLIGAVEDIAPILSWTALKKLESNWSEATKRLEDRELRAGIPERQRAIAAAEKYLTPWVDEYVDAGWDVEIGVENRVITWNVTRTEAASGVEPWARGQELWIYDDTAYKDFPEVLYQLGIPNVVLEGNKISQSPYNGPSYYWCPIGSDESIVLLREKEGSEWRPVQMF